MVNDKLKIGFLSFYYPHLGGSGIITSRLAERLANEGHEIHFIGYDDDKNPSHMRRAGIQLHNVKKIDYPCIRNEPYTMTLASEICNVDSKYDLDLIHANYAVPHSLSAYLAREQRKLDGKYLPYVVTGHGSDIHTNGSKDSVNPMLKLALNEADSLTYVSKDLSEIAKNELGIKKEGNVIPNFVDPDEFYPYETNLRDELSIPEDAFLISHVSNFAPVKRVSHFSELATYLSLSGELENVYFLMCGDGRERHPLQYELEKKGLSSHFRFTGKVNKDKVCDVYNASDVNILTSKHEGNPLTLIESMSCGTPVIGSRVGGIEETIGDSGGLVFELGDVSDLASKVRIFKENEKFREFQSKEAINKAKEYYSPEKILPQYESLFQNVVLESKLRDI